MRLIRITNPMEMFAVEKQAYPLFEKYYEKAKHYIEKLETPDAAWKNCVNRAVFNDYYFYFLWEENEFVGFISSSLVKMQYLTILLVWDYYIPNKGMEFLKLMKQIKMVLGFDEIWGDAPDKVLNAYKRKLKDATVEKAQMVRIKL